MKILSNQFKNKRKSTAEMQPLKIGYKFCGIKITHLISVPITPYYSVHKRLQNSAQQNKGVKHHA